MSRRTRDPGLQPERTLLSWQRTLIVLIAVTLLFMRGPFPGGGPADSDGAVLLRLLPALAVVGFAAVLMVHLRRRWRRSGHGRREPGTNGPPAPLARPWALVLLAAATGALAVVAAATALLEQVPVP